MTGGPFAQVTGLELVSRYPEDVRTFVAHEPPMLPVLPDAAQAFAAEKKVQDAYHERGWGAGMATFMALTQWQGEYTDEFARTAAGWRIKRRTERTQMEVWLDASHPGSMAEFFAAAFSPTNARSV